VAAGASMMMMMMMMMDYVGRLVWGAISDHFHVRFRLITQQVPFSGFFVSDKIQWQAGPTWVSVVTAATVSGSTCCYTVHGFASSLNQRRRSALQL
jgi:hypothetical protein